MEVRRLSGKVIYKENLAGNNWLVRIGFEEKINFVPGQYVSLKVDEGGLRRAYSVASLPGETYIDLVVDVSPMGVGSKYILGLKIGDAVEVLSFLGRFTVRDEDLFSKGPVVFVGTGTGVVPLKQMVEDLLVRKGFRGQIYLVWGMRYEEDLFWIKEIDGLQRAYDNFHFEIVLSKPSKDWPGFSGHVGDILEKMNINWAEAGVYLCGNPEMIADIKERVIKKGTPEARVIYERFA